MVKLGASNDGNRMSSTKIVDDLGIRTWIFHSPCQLQKNPGIPGTPNPQQLAGHSQYGHINAVVIVVVIPILILIIIIIIVIIIITIITIIIFIFIFIFIIIIFIFIFIFIIIIFIFIFILFIFIFIIFIFICILFFIMFFTAIIFIRIMWFITMMCLFPGRVDCARITSDPLASLVQEYIAVHGPGLRRCGNSARHPPQFSWIASWYELSNVGGLLLASRWSHIFFGNFGVQTFADLPRIGRREQHNSKPELVRSQNPGFLQKMCFRF